MDGECGRTKGCFVQCSGGECDFEVTWKDEGSDVAFEISARLAHDEDKWVSVAFSHDLQMVCKL